MLNEEDEYYDDEDDYFGNNGWVISKEDLVPVVSLKALKEWCEENKFGYAPTRVNKEELIKWAEKQARGGLK